MYIYIYVYLYICIYIHTYIQYNFLIAPFYLFSHICDKILNNFFVIFVLCFRRIVCFPHFLVI